MTHNYCFPTTKGTTISDIQVGHLLPPVLEGPAVVLQLHSEADSAESGPAGGLVASRLLLPDRDRELHPRGDQAQRLLQTAR